MPNLGSSDTPVEGQSFGLPAGAELGEDNGELVIKDSNGTIILRRNETESEWQFEGTDLSGINAIDASSASVNDLQFAASNPTDELANRSSGTWYQNDTEYPRQIYITAASDLATDAVVRLLTDINSSQAGNLIQDDKAQSSNGEVVRATASVVVPPSFYYRFRAISGSLEIWFEQTIGVNQ